jgi:hypothetical protein
MNNKLQNIDDLEVMRILEMHSKHGYKTPLLTEQAAVYSKWPSCVTTRTDLKPGKDPKGNNARIYDNGQGTTWSLVLGSANKEDSNSADGGNSMDMVTANSVWFDNKPKGYKGWSVWYCEGGQIKIQQGDNKTYGLKVIDKSGTSLVNGKSCLSNYYNTKVTMGNGRVAYKIVSGIKYNIIGGDGAIKYYIYGDDDAIMNDGGNNEVLENFYCNQETKHFEYGNGTQIPYNTQEGSKRPTESCVIGHPYITNVESDHYQYTKGGFVYTLNRTNNHMKVISGGGLSSDPEYNTWKCVGKQIEITLYYKNTKGEKLMGTNVLEGEATGKTMISQQGGDNTSNTVGNIKQKSKSSTGKKIENKPTQSTYVSTEVGP